MDHDAISQLTTQLSNLLTLIALAFGAALASAVLSTLNTYLSRSAAARILEKVADNTDKTVAGQQDVVEKMDSATKTVKQDAMLAARVATQANVKVLDKIEATLNGGPGGFTELTSRVAHLESKYDVLSKGHVEIKESIDRLTEVVKKQSNY